jgi:hypothetical protein
VLRIGVLGGGVVGRRVLSQLQRLPGVLPVLLDSPDAMGQECRAVVLAGPATSHIEPARLFLRSGVPVVSTSGSVADVRGLLALGDEAVERGVTIVAGAAFSPGLSCVLAQHAGSRFEVVDEIHVARTGAGGPACAREYHLALGEAGLEWRDRAWIQRTGGSGRALLWFPGPIDALDCYRAALAEPLLLVPAFPQIMRVSARRAARRIDRVTARLPMLRPPPAEGRLGAIRVEVRGRRGGEHAVEVLGAVALPAAAAAAVATSTVVAAARGELAAGSAGLAQLVDAGEFLYEIMHRYGVAVSEYEGLPI